MRFFFSYLKDRRRTLLVFLLCCCAFFVTFALYRLPLAAVAYPAAISLFFLLVFGLADLLRVRKKHRALREAARRTGEQLDDLLPEARGLEERDYAAVIETLRAECRALESTYARRFSETMDYYTLWVHQIKTPIASMRLTLQNEDSPLSRRLEAELGHIERYVEMVMVFLRLDSDTTDYVFRESRLDILVRSAVKKFAGEFITKRLSLACEVPEVTVLTDAKWLGFVLEQLLSNALKYTREGGVSVTWEEGGVLCIRDTGVGIAPEDLPRIFEKGYTGLNGRRDDRASGIGLYLCRRVCENLGHGISAESAPGVGTVIRLDLTRRALGVE